MYLKLSCIVLLCVAFSEKFFVAGQLKSEGIIGCPSYDHISVKFIENKSIRSKNPIPSNRKLKSITNCGGSITDGPAKIVTILEQYEPVHCTWTIEAPVGRRVAIYSLWISSRFFNVALPENDDSLNINIYDGSEVADSKTLFKFSDVAIDGAISTGRSLTINLDYNISKKYHHQDVELVFGFL